MKDDTAPRRRTGRPLSFNRDEALRRAMLLFWEYGYDSTTLSQLTAAMGISPPSLYAAFGDKQRLFQEAVRLYNQNLEQGLQIIDRAPTAREAVQTLLAAVAAGFTGQDTPAGCLVINAATNCSAAPAEVQEALTAIRAASEARLRDRMRRDVDAGLLPPDTDTEALAGMYMAVIQGMSSQARDGADRDKLLARGRVAMAAWPAGGADTRD